MTFLLFVLGMPVMAQGIYVNYSDGSFIKIPASEIDSITFFAADTTQENEGDVKAIDLGLSVKWASCNLGATAETDAGGYYAWGETATKSEYSIKTYRFANADATGYASWINAQKDTLLDISGDSAYDAATKAMGKGWRTPTRAEWTELFTKCTTEWILKSTGNGAVRGLRVTGPNGNQIFLPAAGYFYGTSILDNNTEGRYQISGRPRTTPGAGYFASVGSNGGNANNGSNMYIGNLLRPVYSK